MEVKKENIVTFLDAAGRTVIGEKVESEDQNKIKIRNPVVVNIVPQFDQVTGQPSGQMALQLLPLFFKEFIAQKDDPVYFDYHENQITKISFTSGFDFRLLAQYENIFNPSNIIIPKNAGQVESIAPQAPKKSGAPIINLFEEDK